MSEGESGTATGYEGATERTEAERGSESGLAHYARNALGSGILAGLGGGVSVLGGVQALRRGERLRGIVRLALGGALVALAVRQRRRREESAVEPVAEGSAVDRTPPDETAAEEEPERETKYDTGGLRRTETAEDDAVEGEPYERLGEAAFDEYSSEVPVPQRAFNQEFLTLGGEVFWGVREADDAVVVSGRYDPIDEGEAVRYVGSSTVDDERTLSIPNAVRNHWDSVAGGGTAVVGGDDIVFVIVERLAADGQLLVVPEEMTDDVLGESE